jgi:uroporphyrinogen III methyltransferase/synthase
VTEAPPKPLAGRRIVVTRRPEQSAGLCARLANLGATVVEVPLIEVAPPADMMPVDEALRGLDRYHWALFTSANAVRSVSDRMTDLGIPERALTRRKIASVGPSTTRALRACLPDVVVSVEPPNHDAESLLEALSGEARGRRFLFPTSDRARDILPEGLRRAGATVDVVTAYRTVAPAGLRERLSECLRGGADLVTFASPSAVENFVAAAAELVPRIRAAVIGPVTEEACRRAGIEVCAIAEPSTTDGLAKALERSAAYLSRDKYER